MRITVRNRASKGRQVFVIQPPPPPYVLIILVFWSKKQQIWNGNHLMFHASLLSLKLKSYVIWIRASQLANIKQIRYRGNFKSQVTPSLFNLFMHNRYNKQESCETLILGITGSPTNITMLLVVMKGTLGKVVAYKTSGPRFESGNVY